MLDIGQMNKCPQMVVVVVAGVVVVVVVWWSWWWWSWLGWWCGTNACSVPSRSTTLHRHMCAALQAAHQYTHYMGRCRMSTEAAAANWRGDGESQACDCVGVHEAPFIMMLRSS